MAARTRRAVGEDCYAGGVKKLSEFGDISVHLPTWQSPVWWGGHCGSGRSPSSPKFDPAINDREHNGPDLAAPQESALFAPHDGLIRLARWQNNGAGHAVTINHGDVLIDVGERYAGQVHRFYTRHLHMAPNKKWQTKQFEVREGQTVVKGQLLGYVGSSGASAGPHCHCDGLVDVPYAPAYKHKHVDMELVYTGSTKGYWGGGDMESVKGLQRNLNKLGYGPLVVDGNYGPITEATELEWMEDSVKQGNFPPTRLVEVWGPDTGGN